MSSSRFVKLGAAAALALATTACLGGGSTPSELLTLNPTQMLQPGTERTAAPGEAMALLTPTVPRALNTRRIPVYVDPLSIEYLVNATWVEEPAELFRRLLGDTIAARTGRVVLGPDNFAQEAGVTLRGQLRQFGFEPPRMEVVVVYEATLTGGGRALQTQLFEARVPVTTKTAETIAPALNQAANLVAEQVAIWVGG